MDYDDFELKVAPSRDGTYVLSVIHSPAGEMDAEMRLPFDRAAVERRVRAVDSATSTSRAGRDIRVAPASAPLPHEDIEELGRQLFDALLPDQVRTFYRESLAITRERRRGLRVRLRIEAPELAALPWEFAFDTRERSYVGLSSHTPITRYVQVGRPLRPLTVHPPLRILAMIASPSDLARLAVDREMEHLEKAVRHLVKAGHITLDWLPGQTWRDLQKAMRPQRGPWHVFHFIGHGGFDPESREGLIVVCGDDGTSHRMTATQLANLLGDHPSVRLAVLNSCEGARADAATVFSSTASIIARNGVPAVVSMQFEITDEAALEFSRAFYDCLADQMPIEMAVTEARKAIHNRWERGTVEWATPVLHMRSPDGVLFDIEFAARIFGARQTHHLALEDSRLEPVQPGKARPDGRQVDRGLAVLRRKVGRFWVDGFLQKALDDSPLVDLGLDLMHGAVDSPWAGFLDLPDGQSLGLEAGRSIADAFDELGGSLLILGEPGSGKTTTMLALTRDLLARSERAPDRPVPFVVNLSGWALTRKPLAHWLTIELSDKYQIPRRVGQRLLADDRLLPMLDGLDEVDSSMRADAVATINEFADSTAMARIVVCCRYREYTDLPVRLTLNGAVRLQRLTREQVAACIAAGGHRLEALKRVLARDSALLIEARSPLMLGIMIRAYENLPIELLESDDDSAEARRKHVFDTYVDRMLSRSRDG